MNADTPADRDHQLYILITRLIGHRNWAESKGEFPLRNDLNQAIKELKALRAQDAKPVYEHILTTAPADAE